MSLNRILPDDIEYFQLETNPKRLFSSGSNSGITGSVYLYARRTQIEKDLYPTHMFSSVAYKGDETVEAIRSNIVHTTGSTNVLSGVTAYMSMVHHQSVATRLSQQQSIYRFVPPPLLNSNFLRKNVIRKTLFPWYRSEQPTMNWNTTNYNSLNFYRTTASEPTTSSVLIYPNATWEDPNDYNRDGNGYYLSRAGHQRAQYELADQFTFDFWIKPRNYQVTEADAYHAGAIFHMSGAYCVSLHSGSSKDKNGLVDKYRICFQYGNMTSSNRVLAPSTLVNGTNADYGSGGLRVWSSDNVLDRDKWHHVTIRHGGTIVNNGTGSILIDSSVDTYFSSTLLTEVGNNALTYTAVDALFVGNFLEGSPLANQLTAVDVNSDIVNGPGVVNYANEYSTRKYIDSRGTYPKLNAFYNPGVFPTSSILFAHPLNAEVHDLKLYDKYLNSTEIDYLQTNGPKSMDHLRFFVPPFFTYESPVRSNELLTPFYTKPSSSTNTPFGSTMAFSVGGHCINLENYTRDFACGMYAALWALTGSAWTPGSNTILSANSFLYATGSIRKRLYTVLPNDHGDFTPAFRTLQGYNDSRFRDDLNNVCYGVVDLNNIVHETAATASIALRALANSSSLVTEVIKASPDNLTAVTGSSLAVLHRTGDTSSNQVVIFDISNLFYGKEIKPGTLELIDTRISGSNFGIKLKDDGNGNLYRCDATGSSYPTWASVGNVLYNEGLVVIKYPQLYFFGEEQFQISFNGIQNIHVMSIRALAKSGDLISSSNPTWNATDNKLDTSLANEYTKKYVNITGINIHDENLNVVMRTNLAQPVQKRVDDKLVVKIKMDY